MEFAMHACGPGPCLHDSADLATRLATIAAPTQRDLTIDLHCHVLSPQVEALVAGHPQLQQERDRLALATGPRSGQHNATSMLPAAGLRMTSIGQRLADMDAMGVDIQAISPSPSQFYYWADPALAVEIVREGNRHIAAICAQHPRRLVGLGSVALQHPQLAAEQLDHAVRLLGLRGVEISSQVAGCELDDRRLDPFWAMAEQLGCLVFLHPFGTTLGDRLNRFYLSNVIGQPLETTIALSHLIFGGVLDRHPRLRICAAHGGGYLPACFGRSDHAYRVRPEAAQIRQPPSHYLSQLWFDTVVYDPRLLRNLIDQVGASQLVVGTDYPFDMGMYRLHEAINDIAVSPQQRAEILGLNAASLLGIDAKAWLDTPRSPADRAQ
jgi:aminocarboxymuconate-semialdehyde decarboxylase